MVSNAIHTFLIAVYFCIQKYPRIVICVKAGVFKTFLLMDLSWKFESFFFVSIIK